MGCGCGEKGRVRVFLSGPIGEHPEGNKKLFRDYAEEVERRGYEAVNPATHPIGRPWEWYMRKSIALILDCDRVVLLPNCETSRGSKLEVLIATELGMPVEELDENHPIHLQGG